MLREDMMGSGKLQDKKLYRAQAQIYDHIEIYLYSVEWEMRRKILGGKEAVVGRDGKLGMSHNYMERFRSIYY